MSGPWNPNRTKWLSADAYAALSPTERQMLWRQRQVARSGRVPRSRPARYRKGHYARRKLLLMACICIGLLVLKAADTLVAWWVQPSAQVGAIEAMPEAPGAQAPVTVAPESAIDPADAEWAARAQGDGRPSASPGRASGGAGVRAVFTGCKWGGGVNCVVDGDTFYIDGAKVRIAGIDAPETHDYRCAGELALGEQAARQLQAMLNSGAVTMTSIGRDRDVYGRLLRNVAVDGQDVGEALISAGVARAYAGGRRGWC